MSPGKSMWRFAEGRGSLQCRICGAFFRRRSASHGLMHQRKGEALVTLSSSATYDFWIAPKKLPAVFDVGRRRGPQACRECVALSADAVIAMPPHGQHFIECSKARKP